MDLSQANEAREQDDDELVFNGIDGATGRYYTPPMTPDELARQIEEHEFGYSRAQPPSDHVRELLDRQRRATEEHLGVEEGVDPKRLDQAGWGIVFASGDPQRDAIMEAMRPLLERREAQAGPLFRDELLILPNDSKGDWLSRYGMGPGPAQPAKVPYYLLLVGSPQSIPYEFQYQLDVQYAVGRLHFDTIDEYAHYARSVVAAETQPPRARRAVFWGVEHLLDKATQLSARHLIEELGGLIREDQPAWEVQTVLREAATRASLLDLLGGAATPAFLFTASHGMAFDAQATQQRAQQGALLTNEWVGPQEWPGGPIPEDFFVAGDHIPSSANLGGLIAFHFACYGAGTPHLDDFALVPRGQRRAIAPQGGFIAQLPQRMLGHPNGGALAVIGHVERVWETSFTWQRAGAQLAAFQSTLKRLLEGHPIGSATEYFDQRYAELASDLGQQLDELGNGRLFEGPRKAQLTRLWMATNDARSYLILGDPAVRLPLQPADAVAAASSSRNELETIVRPFKAPDMDSAHKRQNFESATAPQGRGSFSAQSSAPRALMTQTISLLLPAAPGEAGSVQLVTFAADGSPRHSSTISLDEGALELESGTVAATDPFLRAHQTLEEEVRRHRATYLAALRDLTPADQ